ncbi:MAG: glycosyltransferase [bacterium]|nr:glycosyltransferase [bacterium]
MRIAILSPSYPPNLAPCGVGDFTRMLVSELVAAGADVLIFTSADYSGPKVSGKIRVFPVSRYWGPAAMRQVARLAREEKAHALLVQYAPDLYPPKARWIPFLPLWMKVLSPGIPTVYSMHTVGVSRFFSKAGAAVLLQSADGILSTNEEVTYLVGKSMPWLRRKMEEVPIGANIEPRELGEPGEKMRARRAELRARLCAERGLEPSGALLAHFGFYYPGKGVEQILDAAGKWKQAGRPFRLFMLGGRRAQDGGFYLALQARARANGLADEVIWTGFLFDEKISEILLAADLFLAPYEGGISSRRGSLMAALAHGAPVVSTPPKVPTEYFRAGENFAEVPFGDADALAERVGALMDNAAARERLRAGAEALYASFRWPAIAARTLDFLRKILREHTPAADLSPLNPDRRG